MSSTSETECPYPPVLIDGPDVVEGSTATYDAFVVGYQGQKPRIDWYIHDPDGLRYSPLNQESATVEFDTDGTWGLVVQARYPSCPEAYWDTVIRRVSVGATDVVDPQHRTPIQIRGPSTVGDGERATFSVEPTPNLAERATIRDVYWAVGELGDGERSDQIEDTQTITIGESDNPDLIGCNAKVESTIAAGDTDHTWTAWRYDIVNVGI